MLNSDIFIPEGFLQFLETLWRSGGEGEDLICLPLINIKSQILREVHFDASRVIAPRIFQLELLHGFNADSIVILC